MISKIVGWLRPWIVHVEHFPTTATPHFLRNFLWKEICATKWAFWYGIVIVVRCEREVDRRLRRLIDFAHATVVLAIGVAHEIM